MPRKVKAAPKEQASVPSSVTSQKQAVVETGGETAAKATDKALQNPGEAAAASPLTGPAGDPKTSIDAASPKVMTRQQKRFFKKKQQKQERRELAKKAGIDLVPKDPRQSERNELLAAVQQELKSLPLLSDVTTSEILKNAPAQKRQLEDLQIRLKNCLNDHTQKVERVPGKKQSAAQIMDQIMELLAAPVEPSTDVQTAADNNEGGDGFFSTSSVSGAAIGTEAYRDLEVEKLSLRLGKVVCWENFKKFQTNVQDLLKIIEDRKKANLRAVEVARNNEKRDRIADRLRLLKKEKGLLTEDSGSPTAEAIVSQTIELTADACSMLFGKHFRSVERHFCVAIETAGGPGAGANKSRITVSGSADCVALCVEFFSNADFSGRYKMSLDKPSVSSLIGPGGSSIRKVEADYNCILNIDKNDTVIVYGQADDANKVLKHIQTIRQEAEQQPQTLLIPNISPAIARAVQVFLSADLRSIESATGVTIKVIFGSPTATAAGEAQEGRILIKGKRDAALDVAHRQVDELIQRLVLKEIQVDEKIRSVFFSGRRDTHPQLTEQLAYLREASRVVFTFNWPKVSFVGEFDEVEKFEQAIKQLFQCASYTPTSIPIIWEQTKSFPPAVRSKIRQDSGAYCALHRPNDTSQWSIELLGTDEQKAVAEEAVQHILRTEAVVEEIVYHRDETRGALLRERGEKLRGLEKQFGIQVAIDKYNSPSEVPETGKIMRVVGRPDDIVAFKEIVDSLECCEHVPAPKREEPNMNSGGGFHQSRDNFPRGGGGSRGGYRGRGPFDRRTADRQGDNTAVVQQQSPPSYQSTDQFPSLADATASPKGKKGSRGQFNRRRQQPPAATLEESTPSADVPVTEIKGESTPSAQDNEAKDDELWEGDRTADAEKLLQDEADIEDNEEAVLMDGAIGGDEAAAHASAKDTDTCGDWL